MRTNYHTHTARCHHAIGTDEDYVVNAIAGGYQLLGFADHTPWQYQTDFVAENRMLPRELTNYVESIHALQQKYKGKIDIHLGLECEYFPDYLPWLKDTVREYQIEYLIFGNHYYLTDEQNPYYGTHTTDADTLMRYEEGAIHGMESGIFSYMAHPDLFMASYPTFDKHCTTISRNICRTAKRLGMPLEYNLGCAQYCEETGEELFPHPDFWKIAAQEGCTAIIGVDAHVPVYLKERKYYDRALLFLQSLGMHITDTIPLTKDF